MENEETIILNLFQWNWVQSAVMLILWCSSVVHNVWSNSILHWSLLCSFWTVRLSCNIFISELFLITVHIVILVENIHIINLIVINIFIFSALVYICSSSLCFTSLKDHLLWLFLFPYVGMSKGFFYYLWLNFLENMGMCHCTCGFKISYLITSKNSCCFAYLFG